jgi:hypothetical protein
MTAAKAGTAKIGPKRARAVPKRPVARRPARKRAAAKRPSPQRVRQPVLPRTTAPGPTVTDEDEASAAREEKHGMIEEAIEPPPSRGGQDIERE